jgi:hypothetical protein
MSRLGARPHELHHLGHRYVGGEILGRDLEKNEARRERPPANEVDRLVCDPSLAREVLGWEATVALNDGLGRTAASVSDHLDLHRADEYHVRAVILARRRSLRLRPYSSIAPKPLIPVGDRRIIEHTLRRLAVAGVHHVDLCIRAPGRADSGLPVADQRSDFLR